MTKPAAETSVNLQDVPTLAGIQHLKLPVIDLARSCEWYRSRLGYKVTMEFVEHGKLMGYALEHRPGACSPARAAPGRPPGLTTSPSAHPPRRPSMSRPRLTAQGKDHGVMLARTARRTKVSVGVRSARHLVLTLPNV
jgi:hypothetical protein